MVGSLPEVPPGALGHMAALAHGVLAKSLTTCFFSPGNVKKLGETYPKISNAQNAELRLRWGQIVLKNDHQEDFWKVRDFLHSQVGDRHLPVPLPHTAGRASRTALSGAGLKGLAGSCEPAVVPPWGRSPSPGAPAGQPGRPVGREPDGTDPRQGRSCDSGAGLRERPETRRGE